MKSRLVRVVVLFLVLASLPLQGVAAVAMPTCHMNDQLAATVASADDHHAMQMDSEMDMSGCEQHTDAHHSDKSCAKCAFCVLAHGIAIIVATPLTGLAGKAPLNPVEATKQPDVLFYSLFRPPRQASA